MSEADNQTVEGIRSRQSDREKVTLLNQWNRDVNDLLRIVDFQALEIEQMKDQLKFYMSPNAGDGV